MAACARGYTCKEVVLKETTHMEIMLTEVVHREAAYLGGEDGIVGCIAA